MARSGPDIFRRYGEAYRAQHTSLSTAQRRVMTAIELYRTAALGGARRSVRSMRPPGIASDGGSKGGNSTSPNRSDTCLMVL
ncbi:hypothetical protein [Rhizobium mongolense]|uniref:hypothetical protein n=1 Tax=Rhizobium mongolense TaxID=57676 RepID=UPI0034A3F4F0